MDSYQAIYDAIRSRIGGVDVGVAIENALRSLNLSFYFEQAQHAAEIAISDVRDAQVAPSVLYRPKVFIDGNQWCALYGTNLVEGVSGFGDTPEKATTDFDKNWKSGSPKC